MLPRPIRSEMSKATERCDSLPGCNYAIWQDSEEFCFTTDAVFLATFPHLVRQARVLELGAGTGAISLLLAARGAAQVVGVDCNPHVVELMRRSIAANGLEECVSAELADLRELKALYRSESFDLIAANPPYRNSGKVRRVATAACHERRQRWRISSAPPPIWSNIEAFCHCAAARTIYGMYGTGA